MAYLLICVAVFGVSLTYGFVWDDLTLVRDRDLLRSLGNWREILFAPYLNSAAGGVYRPLSLLSFALNFAMFGEGGWSFHAVNVLLHALNAWLVFAFVRRFTADRALAFWSGLWFALLPIHTEAVAAVVGRLELLAATFGLLTLILLLPRPGVLPLRDPAVLPGPPLGRAGAGAPPDYRRRSLRAAGASAPRHPRPVHVLLATMCFLLAMLSKEHAVAILPLYVCLTLVLAKIRQQPLGAAMWNIRRAILWLSLAVAVYLLGFRLLALGPFAFTGDVTITRIENFLAFLPAWARVGTAFKILWLYAVKSFWPVTLSTDYGFAQIAAAHLRDWHAWAGVALVALLGWLAVRPLVWRADRWMWSVAAWLILWPLLPVSNFFITTGTSMGDRLMYLPSVGVCLILALIATRMTTLRVVGALALTAMLSFYGWRSYSRALDWRTEQTLLASAAAASPNSLRVRTDVATEWLYAGKDREAERELRSILQLYPDYFHAVHNLGLVYKHQGHPALAERQFWQALRCADDRRVYQNLALVYFEQGRYDRALAMLKRRFPNQPGLAEGFLMHLRRRRLQRQDALAKPQAIAYSGEP